MNIMILDTETIGLEKRYMYDFGYIIASQQENGTFKPIKKRQFIVDQVYNNKMLFETAYYAEKRPLYISLLRGRKAKLKKIGHAFRTMKADIENYEIEHVLAYNMPFDKGVFKFNSNVFNLINPIEHLPLLDIMNFATESIHNTDDYITFCEKNGYITEANNIQTNTENTFKFISGLHDFKESHTSLQDCEIELDILNYSILKGARLDKEYKRKYIKARTKQDLKIIVKDKDKQETEYVFTYQKKINSKKRGAIILEE